VTVGGSAISSPSQALAAGQDYTLLIHQGASANAGELARRHQPLSA
jgi:hypothetical protein